jgi:hypothetical protein
MYRKKIFSYGVMYCTKIYFWCNELNEKTIFRCDKGRRKYDGILRDFGERFDNFSVSQEIFFLRCNVSHQDIFLV